MTVPVLVSSGFPIILPLTPMGDCSASKPLNGSDPRMPDKSPSETILILNGAESIDVVSIFACDHAGWVADVAKLRARAAASWPDRTAPSIVAGSPVFVQSPAKNRLAWRVRAGGRRAFWAGVWAMVARFSLITW